MIFAQYLLSQEEPTGVNILTDDVIIKNGARKLKKSDLDLWRPMESHYLVQ